MSTWLWSWRRKKHFPSESAPQAGSDHLDSEIPRYPPFMQGLPAVPPERLLDSQREILSRIADTAIVAPEAYRRHYQAAMLRFASFAHLLPASQSHHHRGAGGLLRHALEAGLWAMQAADKVLLEAAATPAQRREMEPRWQAAVFLAALCHDAGKPVTDLTITDRDRTTSWSPISDDLYTWAVSNQVGHYFLTWREGRGRQHAALSSLIAERIIGNATIAWIAEASTELVAWLMESLSGNPGPGNLIHDFVVQADQTSVERDLRTMGVAMAGYEIGVPVERHLTDCMRRLVREGIWYINEPGARIWKIAGHVYLVWPAAGEEMARQVREDGVPGVPRTPDGILDMLLERQLAFLREHDDPQDRFWKIAPAALLSKIPGIKLKAIRLRDEVLLTSVPIADVDGEVIDETVMSLTAPQVPQEHQAEHVQAQGQEDVVGAPTQSIEPEPVAAITAPVQPAGEDFNTTKEAKSATAPVKSPPITPPTHRQPAPPTPPPERAENFDPDGAVGEALKALAQDITTGEKVWGRDVLEAGGKVFLKWPDAFAGYGLASKVILEELHSKGWLWVDPASPLKRVLEVEGSGGGGVKAICLTPQMGRWLSQVRDAKPAAPKSQAETTKAPPEVVQQQEPRSGKTVPKRSRKSSPVLPPAGIAQQASSVAPIGTESATTQTGANANEEMDALIAILQSLPAQAGLDGTCRVQKAVFMAMAKRAGRRLTHKRLTDICQQNPARLRLEGLDVIFRLEP